MNNRLNTKTIFIIFIYWKEMSYNANSRLDTKIKNTENNLNFLFILIFIVFGNYFSFYFNLKIFWENYMIEMLDLIKKW